LRETPPDCTGFPITRVRLPIVNPAPFNHATKIAVLRVLRKGWERGARGMVPVPIAQISKSCAVDHPTTDSTNLYTQQFRRI